MIDTLLNKLGGLLEKRFLFASFLPAFCLVAGNLLIASFAIGLEASLTWFGALDAGRQGFLSTSIFVVTFLLAYIFSSLRGSILSLWSGIEFKIPAVSDYLKSRQQRKFLELSEARFAEEPWKAVDDELATKVDQHWVASTGRQPLDDTGRQTGSDIVSRVELLREPGAFRQILTTNIVPLFQTYDGKDLAEFYRLIRAAILRLSEEAELEIQRNRVRIDLTYGSYATIRPTLLGNIVEAYNQYPYRRYNIDGELLWARLAQVTPDSFNDNVQDKKAFLDFSLALAIGLVATALAALFYGPFLWSGGDQWYVWPVVSASLFVISAIFYRTAVSAARDFGNTLRAACDLFRLDLMKSLGRPRPPDLATERAQWEELSQLAAYGTIENFDLRPAKNGSP